ncbi:hypothetical protein AOQ84DRAFT_368402 [Glonium stellatum]|uniref:AA1-like domain-containing protein n=1 Tax=Glonium stellatum TaxID=574774 RepID=A0A8E2ERD2_9PEZI|nr:hypothetical protein AOQ84DRAFT_368402 [Glonium stellatum]
MQFIFSFFISLVLSTLCATAPVLDARDAISYKRDIPKLPYVVTNFGVFEANSNLGVESFISFHFSDPNPTTKIEGDCLRSVNTSAGLYTGSFFPCGASPYGFRYRNDGMDLRRVWDEPSPDGTPPTTIIAYAANQTYWGATNTSTSPFGKFYFREEPLYFLVNQLIA